MIFRLEFEAEPKIMRKLNIEINSREHFVLLGYHTESYTVNSSWFSGSSIITTYFLEELLATKLRALYQRRKGRDLFDLYYAITEKTVDLDKIISGFHEYLKRERLKVSSTQYIQNMNCKIMDDDFLGDIKGLVRLNIKYDFAKAFEKIKEVLLDKL